MLQEYQLLMGKKEKNSKNEIMQHIIPLEANKVHDQTPTDGIPSTSSVTPKTESFTPSFALLQLNPPQSLLRKDDTPLIDFSEGERKRGEKESSSATAVSPSSSNNAYIPEVSSHRDVRVDEGDSKDGKSFLSLLDEENPQYQKGRRSDYMFRRGVASRKDKPDIIKQSRPLVIFLMISNHIKSRYLQTVVMKVKTMTLTFIQKEHL